jgi:non-specific serine/threonine protein kinase/serine/threonine-protein kinase
MDPERFGRLREIVLTAAALPREERPVYLDRACRSGDKLLRSDAESLLGHTADVPDLARTAGLEEMVDTLRRSAASSATRRIPERIGSYRVLGILGEGGMGTVYRAEQVEPIRREVALKLVRQGADSAAVLARFESERQTLALMDHPNIARVLDAGSDEEEKPYFVMELVHGVPITAYCGAAGSGTRERLGLLLDVCRAVSHAHRRGVIHRDLKPSNLLVTSVQGRPVPKVIDFSIAKSLGDPTMGTEFRTRTGQVVGTLEYMSPEQARGEVTRIDVRSDVYSLGVVAYELLAGRPPHETRGLPLHEAVRRIAEEPHESLRGTATETTSTQRIGFDVDTIVGKCLEKQPDRRYGSAGELVEDLERYLDSRPILARPPTATYQLRMLVRRHRGVVAAALALFLALAAGTVGTTVGFLRARAEAGRARTEASTAGAVLEFLNEDLLEAVDPGVQGKDVTMREVLDAAAERLDGKFPDEPVVEARIHTTLGTTYTSLGEYAEAEQHLRQALDLQHAHIGPLEPETLTTKRLLGWALFQLGRSEEADAALQEAWDGLRATLGEEHTDTLSALNGLAILQHRLARFERAEELHREGLSIKRRVLGEDHGLTVTSKMNLGIVLAIRGRPLEAQPLFEEVLQTRRRLGGAEHPATLRALHNLAKLYAGMEARAAEAERLFIELIETQRRVLGEEHPSTLNAMSELARLYAGQKRFDDAERIHREVFETRLRVLGPETAVPWQSLLFLARMYQSAGRTEDAEGAYLEAADGLLPLGEDHTDRLTVRVELGSLYVETGHPERGERLLRGVVEALRRRLGGDDPWTVYAMHLLVEEARDLFRGVWEARKRTLGEREPETLAAQLELARHLARQDVRAGALELLGDLVDHGWAERAILDDAAFARLHGDPRFDSLAGVVRRRLDDDATAGD